MRCRPRARACVRGARALLRRVPCSSTAAMKDQAGQSDPGDVWVQPGMGRRGTWRHASGWGRPCRGRASRVTRRPVTRGEEGVPEESETRRRSSDIRGGKRWRSERDGAGRGGVRGSITRRAGPAGRIEGSLPPCCHRSGSERPPRCCLAKRARRQGACTPPLLHPSLPARWPRPGRLPGGVRGSSSMRTVSVCSRPVSDAP